MEAVLNHSMSQLSFYSIGCRRYLLTHLLYDSAITRVILVHYRLLVAQGDHISSFLNWYSSYQNSSYLSLSLNLNLNMKFSEKAIHQ
jgi:hypothetical protein